MPGERLSAENFELVVTYMRANMHLTNKQIAKNLVAYGIDKPAKYYSDLRRAKKIGYGYMKVKEAISHDVQSGIKIKTADDIMKRYNVSRTYANSMLRLMNRGDPLTYHARKVVEHFKPVRVNTMAHAVQQLTANDAQINVAA